MEFKDMRLDQQDDYDLTKLESHSIREVTHWVLIGLGLFFLSWGVFLLILA